MRACVALALLVALVSGCATTTVESRKKERYAAYSSLSPDQKQSVDLGQIKVGMPMDAVFIAWGKPSQILHSETSTGSRIHWLYSGTYVQSVTYWGYPGSVWPAGRYYGGPELVHDYAVRDYYSAEVIFENGAVKEWRTLPQPQRW